MPAPGETSLPALLSGLSPRLDPTTWIYLCIRESGSSPLPANISNAILASAKMTFREAEGLTAILPLASAVEMGLCDVAGNQTHSGLQAAMPSRLITLEIQSSLDAVGMMGVIAREFSDAHVPCNVVAGFQHDHLFVPVEMKERAMQILVGIQKAASAEPEQSST